MKIKEKLTDPSVWTQGAFARTPTGKGVDSHDPEAVCWCLFGLVEVCYPPTEERGAVFNKIHNALMKRAGRPGLMVWNDNPNRTFEDVKVLVEEVDV